MSGEFRMKKGFIFSIDAIIGIAVVFIAMSSMTFFYLQDSSSPKIFHAVDQNASDSAIIGFYLGKSPADLGLTGTISGSAKQGFCGKIFDYNPDNGLGAQSAPEDKNYCGGI
jgi:hypothetical protein